MSDTVKTPLGLTRPVRLAADLHEMAATIAAFDREAIADSLDHIVRGPIQARFDELPAEMRERALARLNAPVA